MKTLSFVMAIVCFSNVALADCNFTTGITSLPNGNYEYVKPCHIKVGEIKRDLGIANTQNEMLIEAVKLKDLALTKANERAGLWMDTSFKLEARVETMDKIYNRNKIIYFGLGVLATGLAIYAVDQIHHR